MSSHASTSSSMTAANLSSAPSVASSSRSSSVGLSTTTAPKRLTLEDIHIPAGFEIAKGLGEDGQEYPSEENIQKAAEVLQSLRGRMPDGSDGQVAACDYCRRRKIRCDRVKPTCGSCIQSGRKCTTEDMLRKRGPPSKKERAVLEAAGIIFRGTRPHRRRRTATTSLGSGAASKQEELMKKAKEAANSRTRANSTDSNRTTAALASTLANLAQLNGESKSSWMEMLSIATQAPNPFADSPGSSPSEISSNDTLNLDGGACDYFVPNGTEAGADGIFSATNPLRSAQQWDNMWTHFGEGLRQKHAAAAATAAFAAAAPLPFVVDENDKGKGLPFFTPFGSVDAGALDWSGSNLSLQQYQMLFPPVTNQHLTHEALQSTASLQNQQPVQLSQGQQNMFSASANPTVSEAAAFESAMAHFFPPGVASQHLGSSTSSASDSDLSPVPDLQAQVSPQPLFSFDALSAF